MLLSNLSQLQIFFAASARSMAALCCLWLLFVVSDGLGCRVSHAALK